MIRKTMGFSVPVLAAILALSLAAPARAQGLKYLPGDTEVVISLNLKQVWNSKLVKDYSALIKQIQGQFNAKIDGNEVAAEIKKSLGIDPFQDIDTVTIGMSELGKDAKNGVIVLEGKFNPDKFSETGNKAAKDNPEVVKSVPFGGATVYQITKSGEDPFFVGLLNKNTLVVSKNKEGMTGAVNAQGQNLKKETADLLQIANLKKSLTVVMTAGALQEAIKQGNNAQAQFIAPFLKDLNGAIITANVAADVDLVVHYVTKDAAAAQKMAEQTNQGLEVVKVLVSNQAKKDANAAAVADILKTLKVSAQGNSMIITGTVSHEVVDGVMKKIENFLP